MNYAICIKAKKPQLVSYRYNWAANKFYYTFGTSSREFWDYDELPFKIIADLTYEEKYSKDWPHTEYPAENVLKVKVKPKSDFQMMTKEIAELKGFKTFFNKKNIKTIEIIKS